MGAIAAIFYNKSEKRLRAGWRILIHLVLFVLLGVVGAFVASQINDRAVSQAVNAVIYLLAALGATWLAARFIDRRRFAEYGFHMSAGWIGDFVFGLVLGAALMSGIVFVMPRGKNHQRRRP